MGSKQLLFLKYFNSCIQSKPQIRFFRIWLLTAFILSGLAGPLATTAEANEQVIEPAGTTPASNDGPTRYASTNTDLKLEAGGSAVAPADVSGAGMAVWRDNIKASYNTENFGVDVGYKGSYFDFSKVGHLPFGGYKPFDSLHMFDTGLTVKGGLWGDVSGFANLRGSLGYERDLGNGFGGTAIAGIYMPLNSYWVMRVGGGVSFNKVETQPVPVISFRYQSDDRFIADLGFPHTEISWRGASWWTIRLTGGLEAGYYQLASDNSVARNGYVTTLSPQAGLWFDLHPMEGFSASIGALYSLPGNMTFYQEDGSRIKRFGVGGAPGGAMNLRYSF